MSAAPKLTVAEARALKAAGEAWTATEDKPDLEEFMWAAGRDYDIKWLADRGVADADPWEALGRLDRLVRSLESEGRFPRGGAKCDEPLGAVSEARRVLSVHREIEHVRHGGRLHTRDGVR
jgi:hypothetical protein